MKVIKLFSVLFLFVLLQQCKIASREVGMDSFYYELDGQSYTPQVDLKLDNLDGITAPVYINVTRYPDNNNQDTLADVFIQAHYATETGLHHLFIRIHDYRGKGTYYFQTFDAQEKTNLTYAYLKKGGEFTNDGGDFTPMDYYTDENRGIRGYIRVLYDLPQEGIMEAVFEMDVFNINGDKTEIRKGRFYHHYVYF